jgi:hypothetical protein
MLTTLDILELSTLLLLEVETKSSEKCTAVAVRNPLCVFVKFEFHEDKKCIIIISSSKHFLT